MWRRFRIALMWLLAAAMPLQGMAAVTMVACGPSHHRMGQPGAEEELHAEHGHAHSQAHDGTMSQEGGDHHHPPHSGDLSLDLQAGLAQDQADSSAADPAADAMDDLHKASQSRCSACASCCALAALPTASPTFTSPSTVEFFEPFIPSFVAVFLTGGQERPPRAFLA